MRASGRSTLAITNFLKTRCGQSTSVSKTRSIRFPSNTKSINALLQQGKLKESIDSLALLRHRGAFVDPDSFAMIFRSCTDPKSMMEGRRLHAYMVVTGFMRDVFVLNHLMGMYGKCGDLEGANDVFRGIDNRNLHSWNILLGCLCDAGYVERGRRLFDEMPRRDSVSWNTVIAAYDQCGLWEEALDLFTRMRHSDANVDTFTVSIVVSACTSIGSIEMGTGLHSLAIQLGTELSVYVGSALVELYAKCGNVDDARKVFQGMPTREIFTWNIMLGGYFDSYKIEEALGFFQKFPDKNVVSWTTIIQGCIRNSLTEEAIGFFRQMRFEGIYPDELVFVTFINSCSYACDLDEGSQMHALVIKYGFEGNTIIVSALVDMYAKCGNFKDSNGLVRIMSNVDKFTWSVLISEYAKHGHTDQAEELFDSLKDKSSAIWNSLLAGYCELQMHQEALELFNKMQVMGFKGDEFTFANLVKVLGDQCVIYGQQVHVHTIKMALDSSVFVGSSLIEMYTKFFYCEYASLVFSVIHEPNLVAWNSIISGYAQNERGQEAIENFNLMRMLGMKPDHVSFSSILNACTSLLVISIGMMYHGLAYKSGFGADVVVGSAVVDMYSKCGNMGNAWNAFEDLSCPNVISWTAIIGGYVKCGMRDEAQAIFDIMPVRNVVSWNVMISGHAQLGCGREALRLFVEMKRSGVLPDRTTYVNLLTGCSSLLMEEQGKQVHAHIVKGGYFTNANVNITLTSMYHKFPNFSDMHKLATGNYEPDATCRNMSN